VNDLTGAADRAGSAIRDQIASIVDAARSNADEIEKRAREGSAAELRDARQARTRVYQAIIAAERSLDELRTKAGREGDNLRALLGQAEARAPVREAPRLTSGVGDVEGAAEVEEVGAHTPGLEQGEGADAPEEPEPVTESGPAPEPEPASVPEPAPEPESAEAVPEEQAVPEPDAVTEDATELEGGGTAEDALPQEQADPLAGVPDPLADDSPALASQRRSADDASDRAGIPEEEAGSPLEEVLNRAEEEIREPEAPEAQAQERVSGSSDEYLVEKYAFAMAAFKTAEKDGSADDAAYWSAFLAAIVQESASRPDFGADLEDPSLSRRERKRERGRYDGLLQARAQYLAADQPGAED